MTANRLLAHRAACTLTDALADHRIRRITPTLIAITVTNDPACPTHPRNRSDTIDLASRLIEELLR